MKIMLRVMLISILVAMFISKAKADPVPNPVLDQITMSLIDHVETVAEVTTAGSTKVELLSNVIGIGKFENAYIGGIDAGFMGDTKPAPDQREGINYTAGVKIHLSPFIRHFVKFDPNWTFLNSVEVNPRYSYDFTAHHGQLGICLALAFGLKPVQ